MNGIHLNYNRAKLTKRKPKDWIQNGYKIVVPYEFKWREKIGPAQCDCKHCEENFQPYYGVTWYHRKDCALMKYINLHPQVLNLWQYSERDMTVIATTD